MASKKSILKRILIVVVVIIVIIITVGVTSERKFWGEECEDLGISGQEGQCVQKKYCKTYRFWRVVDEGIQQKVVPCGGTK